jgi:hypothetical protein
MRSIGPWIHGVIDYLLVVILVIGPGVAGFAGRQAAWCWILAAIHLGLTAVTRFPLGMAKVVSFPMHGAVELIVALLLVVLPWVANFSAGVHSRNFFVVVGLLIFLIWLLTDYRNLRGKVVSAG